MILNNSLSGKKEPFSIHNNTISLYVCGITPYSSAHIGHGRCYVSFDLLVRFFEYRGIKVSYCRNITDIDDKLLEKAAQEYGSQKEYQRLVNRYMPEFLQSLELLNCRVPTYEPRVTDHIPQIIQFIEGLIEKGYAYRSDDDIYFSVSKSDTYGDLSGQKTENLKKEHRVSIENKRDPLDFVLWKSEQEPFWNSPWGNGRPGWHVECSVMATEYLGSQIDIHGGGRDLIFPHHENEKALSEGFFGNQFVRCWMHNGLVTVHREKMSKSLGNFILLHETVGHYKPDLIRYFFIQHHYHSPLEWTDELVQAATKSYQRLVQLFDGAENKYDYSDMNSFPLMLKMDAALQDDLNTPVLFALIFTHFNTIAQDKDLKDALFSYCVRVLGLSFAKEENDVDMITDPIKELLKRRDLARKNHDWAAADQIRDELLTQYNYTVVDKKID
jgi:cysteinyl-tRNA synthetase